MFYERFFLAYASSLLRILDHTQTRHAR